MDFSKMAGGAWGLSLSCTGCSPGDSVCMCVCVLRLVGVGEWLRCVCGVVGKGKRGVAMAMLTHLFFPTRKDGVLYRFTFIWVFHPFSYCFCHWTNAVLKPGPLKSLTKIACLHSFNQKKRPLTDGGEKNLRASGEKAPATFSVHCKKGLVSRSWHLPGFGS